MKLIQINRILLFDSKFPQNEIIGVRFTNKKNAFSVSTPVFIE